jgi:cytochrome P450
MNPYFSVARIRRREPLIQGLVDKLCNRLREFGNTGRPLVIQHAYTCYATDVVSDYVTGQGFHYLDAPDFVPQWTQTLSGIAKAGILFKPFPWLIPLMKSLPESWVSRMNPGMDLLFQFQRRCVNFIRSVIDSQSVTADEKATTSALSGQPTLFDEMLKSDLPPREKSESRLAEEMQILVSAGAETTAKTLTWITFHLLHNPEIMQELQDELHRMDPDQTAGLVQFEQMPYLVSLVWRLVYSSHSN